jgi:hypothetical protein
LSNLVQCFSIFVFDSAWQCRAGRLAL